MTLFETQAE